MELRNEAFLTGRVIEVDGFMNVTMKEVDYFDPMRRKKRFDCFFVQNRLIRWVQIPTEIDMKKALHNMFNKENKGIRFGFYFLELLIKFN